MDLHIKKEKEILSHLIDASLLFTELTERFPGEKRDWVSHMDALENIIAKRIGDILK
jgi:hypothetical protein